jgi:hypothetical protein
MLRLDLCADIKSALFHLVSKARWKDISAILRKEGRYYVAWCEKVSPNAIVELQNFDILHLVVEGKTTKTKLTLTELEYFNELVNSNNAWLS